MKCILIGSVESSYEALKIISKSKLELTGVVTTKNKKINSDFHDLTPFRKKNDIDIFYSSKLNDSDLFSFIKRKKPEIIFCIGWSRLLNKSIIEIAKKGIIGFHPSDLPYNRGRHPIIWAIALGLKQTASSFFYIDTGVDTGKIINQKKIIIKKNDDAKKLYKKIITEFKKQLRFIISDIVKGNLSKGIKQQKKGNFWRKRNHLDSKIDWRMSAENIDKLVKSLTKPYIGSDFIYKNKEYKLWKTKVIKIRGIENIEHGKVVKISSAGKPTIKCGQDCIEITNVHPKLNIKKGSYL